MTPRQRAMQLLNDFLGMYRLRHGQTTVLNKNVAKWAAMDLIDSFGYDECKRGMEYYFAISTKHSWNYYAKNCGLLIGNLHAAEKDKHDRMVALERAKRWLND